MRGVTLHFVAVLSAFATLSARAQAPLTTAFTYQGELASDGAPATGAYDIRFRLYDAADGGMQIGSLLCVDNVEVVNGRFATSLDFGAAAFAGQQRFLEVEVRQDTGLDCFDASGYTPLTPRQELTAAPNATFAQSAATANIASNAASLNGQLPSFYQNAANLTGTIADARLSGNVARLNANQTFTGLMNFSNPANVFAGSFSGSGAALTNLNGSNISAGSLARTALSTDVQSGLGTLAGDWSATPYQSLGFATAGSAPRFAAVSGSFVYVVNRPANTLQVFSVSSSGVPTLVSTTATAADPGSVAVSGSFAYVLSSTSNTLQIFNITNPAAPIQAGSVATEIAPLSIAVSGSFAYVVNNTSNTLQIFNIGNPATPTLAGGIATGSRPISVAVSGSLAFVANNSASTLEIFDVTTPSAITLVGSAPTGSSPNAVATSGSFAYVVNSGIRTLEVFDVSNPATPTLVASAATGNLPLSVAVSGTFAYVVNRDSDTLQVFDITNPAAIAPIESIATQGGPASVAVSGSLAYVVNVRTPFRLQVFSGATRVGFNVPLASSALAGVSIPAANLSGELPASFVRLSATQTFTGANTFTSPGNTFLGSFTGNGSGLTDLNAANLTGSISAGRLSSVPASLLTGTVPASVLNGADGGGLTSLNASNLVTGSVSPALLTIVPAANLSGNIPAARLNIVPAASLTGSINAALLTSVPAGNLTGTIPLATIPGTVARIGADQAFSGANAFTNPANSFQGTFAGNGSGLTDLDAASLTGTVAPARLTSVPAASLTGTVPAAALSGVSGAGLTNLNAANLTGTLPIAALPSNLVRLDTNQTFTGLMTFSNTSNVFNGSFTGNGAGLTNLNAANLTGAIAPARLTSVPAANVTGTLPLASIPVGVARIDGDQSYNGVNSFTNSQNFFRGSGADLTSLNATNITSGTISPNRLPSSVVRTDNNNAFGLFNNSFVSLSIGTTVSPARSLQIGDVNAPGSTGLIRLESRASSGANQRAFDIGVVNGGTSDTGSSYSFVIADTNRGIANPDFMIRFSNGNVGLGTNNPTNRLTVNGNMNVTGSVAKAGGSFKIDHPLDPENKYLYHSFVESPDMMNIYNGNIVTNADGYATITLPDYFEALNRDFRYQLTVIDESDDMDVFLWAKVVRKISGNQFAIRTSRGGVEVSWQVTGVRQDAWAEKNRIPNSVDKVGSEKGKLLHPEAFGRPASQGVYAPTADSGQGNE